MTDYRAMFDRNFIASFDLNGNDVIVKIAKVEAQKLVSQRGTSLKPVLHFEGKEKGFVANKTNAKTIAAMHGNDTAAWIGKSITLYATTTQVGPETLECIRVRPTIPKPEKPTKAAREPGQEG